MRTKLPAWLMILVFITGLFSVGSAAGIRTVNADDNGRFSGKVSVLKQDSEVLSLQVEVTNVGDDFDGTVRLMLNVTDGDGRCAFDTPITLPNGGDKKFTVRIPVDILGTNRTKGNGTLFFIDESGKSLSSINFSNLFNKTDTTTGVGVGILSDDPDSLSYLDMNGMAYDYFGDAQPVKLMELNADNLNDELSGLYFLVIDQFDVSKLPADEISAIEEWTKDGGWLIIGTGERAADTMDAFDSDFLQVKHGNISKPGTVNSVSALADSVAGYYGDFTACGVDFKNMAVVELSTTSTGDYEGSSVPGNYGPRDDGAIGVLPFSLGEDELKGLQNYVIEYFYYEVMSNAASYNNYRSADSDRYYVQRGFSNIDNANTEVDFSILGILIVIYVIIVGPILYLILSRAKKREWYWAAVPVVGVLFIAMVFFFGQNLRLGKAKIYSVAVARADGNDEEEVNTYFYGYNSGTKPWSVKLSDDYDYAGPMITDFSSINSQAKEDDYHYFITEGDGVSIGIKPGANFENAYLKASGKTKGCGSIDTEGLVVNITTQSGIVTNNTPYDFPYILLMGDECMLVFSDLKSGETLDVAKEYAAGNYIVYNNTAYWDDVYYSLVDPDYGNNDVELDKEMTSALYAGGDSIQSLISADGKSVVVAGITKNFGSQIVSDCTEYSYGCLYTVSEQEAGDAKDN
jgi:hypothetical protein